MKIYTEWNTLDTKNKHDRIPLVESPIGRQKDQWVPRDGRKSELN